MYEPHPAVPLFKAKLADFKGIKLMPRCHSAYSELVFVLRKYRRLKVTHMRITSTIKDSVTLSKHLSEIKAFVKIATVISSMHVGLCCVFSVFPVI